MGGDKVRRGSDCDATARAGGAAARFADCGAVRKTRTGGVATECDGREVRAPAMADDGDRCWGAWADEHGELGAGERKRWCHTRRHPTSNATSRRCRCKCSAARPRGTATAHAGPRSVAALHHHTRWSSSPSSPPGAALLRSSPSVPARPQGIAAHAQADRLPLHHNALPPHALKAAATGLYRHAPPPLLKPTSPRLPSLLGRLAPREASPGSAQR
uniref:Uncharacterized protein n=1 Tax=Arundo donax TaxID=35708 RepID=A0A0A9A5P7_ARUDO